MAKSSSRFKPNWACIVPAKEETDGETLWNKKQVKEAEVRAWKSITKEECKGLVMSLGHRFDAVIASKGLQLHFFFFFFVLTFFIGSNFTGNNIEPDIVQCDRGISFWPCFP